eukprot:TRINITY_DN27253_c0_g1_i3.p1 TRINITY_DN27253_c0_g1~~TRINITY_DN27253_c0_g1_i3.p1  ORF type:complete len:384 (+),score=48.64 TRINITY_DN27253_c0_g1_i3:86-1237(+)
MGGQVSLCQACQDDSNRLGWRNSCVATPWEAPAEHYLDLLTSQVHDVLISDTFRHPPPLVTPDGPDMDKVHSKDQVIWYLKRMNLANSVDAPPMRVVWWGTIEKLGRLPRWPEDREHILDAEKVLVEWAKLCDDRGGVLVDGVRREICFSFFSHRWERPAKDHGSSYECGKNAHPDTAEHKKAKVLATYGSRGACPIFPDTLFDYYFYVDFACIDQDDNVAKLAGVTTLPMHVASCVELLFYDSKTVAYEPRGWTRAERMIGYAFSFSPLFVYIGEEYPERETDFKALCNANPDVYSMPNDDGKVLMAIADPLAPDSALTNPKDRDIVRKLCEAALRVPPLNMAWPAEMQAYKNKDYQSPLKFGHDKILLDTEHQRMDVQRSR